MWIVQEILMAQDLVVLCGTEQISWDLLESFTVYLRDRLPLDFEVFQGAYVLPPAFRSMMDIFFERRNLDENNSADFRSRLTMENLLDLSKDRSCEDIRDKIYGIIGLAIDGGDIIVDYSCSVFQLRRRVLDATFMNNPHSLTSNRWQQLEQKLDRLLDIPNAHDIDNPRRMEWLRGYRPVNERAKRWVWDDGFSDGD